MIVYKCIYQLDTATLNGLAKQTEVESQGYLNANAPFSNKKTLKRNKQVTNPLI